MTASPAAPKMRRPGTTAPCSPKPWRRRACPSPAGALRQEGLPAEPSAQEGLPAEALAQEGLPAEALANAGLSRSATSDRNPVSPLFSCVYEQISRKYLCFQFLTTPSPRKYLCFQLLTKKGGWGIPTGVVQTGRIPDRSEPKPRFNPSIEEHEKCHQINQPAQH